MLKKCISAKLINKKMVSIKEAIVLFLEERKLTQKYQKAMIEQRAKEIWIEIVGEGLERLTPNIQFKNGVFYVYASFPVALWQEHTNIH